MADIYEQLRARLDEMATGYPATEGGVEIRILRQLFTEEDAALFLAMELKPRTVPEVAARVQAEPEAMAVRLEDMARRGLVFRLKDGDEPRYFPIPFIVGIYEFQLNNLSPELLKDISEYYLSGLGATFHGSKTPHRRSIPISTGIVPDGPIAPYDDAEAIIRTKKRIAVAECFCRKAVRMYGKTCTHPLETCLQFDSFADYYVENGLARYISMDEALATVSYTHLRAHETVLDLVCRLLLEKKKNNIKNKHSNVITTNTHHFTYYTYHTNYTSETT